MSLLIGNLAVYFYLYIIMVYIFISVRSLVPQSVVERTLEQQYDVPCGEPVMQSAAGSVFHSRQCKCCGNMHA